MIRDRLVSDGTLRTRPDRRAGAGSARRYIVSPLGGLLRPFSLRAAHPARGPPPRAPLVGSPRQPLALFRGRDRCGGARGVDRRGGGKPRRRHSPRLRRSRRGVLRAQRHSHRHPVASGRRVDTPRLVSSIATFIRATVRLTSSPTTRRSSHCRFTVRRITRS